ncbi:hypothetical protein P22_3940 [Propionispora sp. 2/2-37]|uniref:hypothetical protein n=1 Tax=Propionispora sp. 2/2-37 TaxID=1677858 RepID=UPI0006BB61AC|nr:hypothetical protein [Propionispora sp. 2/2-37]CUH97794.1 hypothetical protein P22_3940 [Propionispora sp. 2/2-37]
MSFTFIRNLFHITENIGFDDNEIDEAVKQWGTLPTILKKYYKELGKHKGINRSQNFLREPNELIDEGDYLVFYIENQNCAEWGIKKEDLIKDNPSVYCKNFDGDFCLENNTLTEFLNAMALFQAASWGLSYASEDIFMITEEQAEQIRDKFPKKPYELQQWMKISFYGKQDDEVIMLIVNDNYDLIFASEDENHYKKIEEFMNTLHLEEY